MEIKYLWTVFFQSAVNILIVRSQHVREMYVVMVAHSGHVKEMYGLLVAHSENLREMHVLLCSSTVNTLERYMFFSSCPMVNMLRRCKSICPEKKC